MSVCSEHIKNDALNFPFCRNDYKPALVIPRHLTIKLINDVSFKQKAANTQQFNRINKI